MTESAVDDLKSVFEVPKTEGYTTTGKVMILPSGVTKDVAAQAIEQIDLEPILRDIGIIVAREIADELQRMGLRPADYVDLPDMGHMVAARVGSEVSLCPPPFLAALMSHLRMRG
jgi:hypothetical protein